MNVKEGEVVLCTVKNITPASVSVDIEGNGSGSIVMSEVAAGRIRNLREYISLNKKIVCKVLKIAKDHVELSLRRVTGKEREQVEEKFKKEKIFTSLISSICSNPKKILSNIKEKYEISDFFDQLKENSSIISEFLSEEESEKIKQTLKDKGETEKIVKKLFILKSHSSSGLEDIKSVLNHKEADIRYLGSSQFSITIKGKNFKEANHKIQEILQVMEHMSKDKKIQYEIKQ